ncbi:MAG: DMT family transporter [Pseudomonadota bacterium]
MAPTTLMFAVMAFAGGMLVAAQGPIYARLSAGLNRDYLLAVFLAFSTAAALTGALAVLSGSFRSLTMTTITHLPLWVWLGGVFGAVHVVISMQSIPALGVTLFLVVVVAGNLVGAAIYDHIGAMGLEVRSLSWTKGLGLLLVIAGVGIVVRG